MSKVESIEQEIEKLSPEELREFRRWFREFDAQVWDEQLESDINSGKLDAIAEEALEDYRKGKATEI